MKLNWFPPISRNCLVKLPVISSPTMYRSTECIASLPFDSTINDRIVGDLLSSWFILETYTVLYIVCFLIYFSTDIVRQGVHPE